MKDKTITLKFMENKTIMNGRTTDSYKVIKVTDSTEYHPGAYLSPSTVDQLCQKRDWKVSITE